ncbi:nucleotidyltransferase domain-containing protein [Roseinatronobacter monicus]|uniref:cGAS/DncV-like nucleotidyltransferase C-terminal helical domain-containing protein n=1 Tax=Roseinatronobacter monicus TaxID=393481 RepID=A0A543KBE5_9RHOB|nr:nucleotidyltransferase [Roseinatronobacter monicus]TQM92408.1 hypothetical protein BD293_1013 [Roseinatronobacter monicus]
MAISEAQLETWSHPGAQEQSKNTYATIKAVLEDANSPYRAQKFDSFLQGSYGNSTNIRVDSDVDIALRLSSINYYDLSSLDDAEKARFHQNLTPGSYSHKKFKEEVLEWLTTKFGNGVKPGKKAIFIPGNGSRRDADVLVCTRHLRYTSYSAETGPAYRDGICFWTYDGDKIVNYPKQHLANCTSKNQATSTRFKSNVRVFKNWRNRMIEAGYLEDGVAPSYFIEGMLWNVPNQNFVSSYQQTYLNCHAWLKACDISKLFCANGYHFLLRDGTKVCWNEKDFNKFRAAMVKYWNDS